MTPWNDFPSRCVQNMRPRSCLLSRFNFPEILLVEFGEFGKKQKTSQGKKTKKLNNYCA